MLFIVNYGLGNIASVLNMVRKVGGNAIVTSDPGDVGCASKLILPGVGAFDHGINQLQSRGLVGPIRESVSRGVPTLGICLGMQLLAKRSEEGKQNGLGVIDAEFRRFKFAEGSPELRIPHVGWNQVRVVKENPLIPVDARDERFYFTHSYYAACNDEADVLATAEYGFSFTAAYGRGTVFGVQFHPEKSHRFGMALMKRFVAL